MGDLKQVINDSFIQYAGAVLQNRALIDVRDGLKPSARQIFYSMLLHKLTSDKPHKKTANAVGMAMADFYIHGDASCEGVIMRAGQPFAMRYPLVDVKGNAGSLIESGNWAAMRYTESRLSKLIGYMFDDIDKETITEWRDSYDNSKQYPAVLPSKGFYNIVNGTQGIGIGMASSIPQYNLKELNNALIHLLNNPNCDFEDIYCAPDFATGAILFNEDEVKQSMKNGNGFACKLRSVVDFDNKERCFVVTEIPYGVYTNTICGELEKIIESEENPGIERFNDLTGKTPLIKIYLNKKANPDKLLKYLFKNTSLQSYFGINFTMLDKGRFPKVFTWKEMLQAHLDHEEEVYRRGFQFDLNKIEERIHIIEGLLICMANIEEVVQTIKSSSSTATAAQALQEKFLLDNIQAKAVLDMKLARLAHLEVQKLEKEKNELQIKAEEIRKILNNENLLKKEIEKGLTNIANKFGDERRTKILNLTSNDDEPIEVKQLQINLTNRNNVFVTESSTLYTQKRGGVGGKLKLETGEYVTNSISAETNEQFLCFTNTGNVYNCPVNNFTIGEKSNLLSFLNLKDWEQICAITTNSKTPKEKYILFITKNGLIKKTELSEYNMTRRGSLKALSLNEGDEIIKVLFTNNENIGIMTELGNFLITKTDDIRATGRVTQGVHGIKLNDGDKVIAAHLIPKDSKLVVSISGAGLIKKTEISEFTIQGKNTKGAKIQKLNEGDWMADFLPINNETEIVVASTKNYIKIKIMDIPLYSRGTLGSKSIKLKIDDNITNLIGY